MQRTHQWNSGPSLQLISGLLTRARRNFLYKHCCTRMACSEGGWQLLIIPAIGQIEGTRESTAVRIAVPPTASTWMGPYGLRQPAAQVLPHPQITCCRSSKYVCLAVCMLPLQAQPLGHLKAHRSALRWGVSASFRMECAICLRCPALDSNVTASAAIFYPMLCLRSCRKSESSAVMCCPTCSPAFQGTALGALPAG
jgi:hypothetical protein